MDRWKKKPQGVTLSWLLIRIKTNSNWKWTTKGNSLKKKKHPTYNVKPTTCKLSQWQSTKFNILKIKDRTIIKQ